VSGGVVELLQSLIDRFNRYVERTPKVAEELAGIERTIAIRLSAQESYAVDLAGARLSNLRPGMPEHPHLKIVTDAATFRALLAKEIGPMKALVTRRLHLEGSLEDKLLLRRLL
jgi:putative sterol carrier protein